ncbi:alpha-L-fucosidase [Kutzneria buriramensis]|uniref:alpha-L-fucosidase n=1 Tax=Kutzneria buriramensis TaxID=1045776 RepID=A0A3E0H7S0_9PSEU|nr:alpha-L-fucosidase [Kutzneria buriramensis]REH39490.1 alpha-L-fucosidase [Kutzneria buriramensis]
MKRMWLALVAALMMTGLCAAPAWAAPGDNHAHDDPFTAARTAWWRGDRFGMFIHFGDYSNWQGVYQKPDGTTCQSAEWILQNCQIPMKEYEAKAATFNPAAFDATKIVNLAEAAGQRYIVITAKHHDGYAMWPTKVNTWNLRDHSAFDKHRDILAELKAAADKAGITFGIYYSIKDWHDTGCQHDFPAYRKNMYAQLKELVTDYHPALLWFDGACPAWSPAEGDNLQNYLHGLNPDLVVNNRVGKRRIVDGDYSTPERTIPAAPVDGAPWETCDTIASHWGYNRNDTFKSPVTLTRNLLDIVSRDGNFLLNIGPTDTGAVPTGQSTVLQAMGSWLSANGSAVRDAGYTGLVADPDWGAVSRSGDKLYASVYDWGRPLHLTARSKFTITGARVLGSTQSVAWKASGDGYDLTPSGGATNGTATVIELTVTTPPTVTTAPGTGLTAQYWPNATFTGKPSVTRVDPTLNFAWQLDGSPAPSIPVGAFSARWTGSVAVPVSDNYSLATVSDDTAQVWVDGKLVIDASKPHAVRVDKAVVGLTAGRHTIRVDYTQAGDEAYLKLLWSSPNIGQRIIPAGSLYPA